jgi:hypothetical protein
MRVGLATQVHLAKAAAANQRQHLKVAQARAHATQPQTGRLALAVLAVQHRHLVRRQARLLQLLLDAVHARAPLLRVRQHVLVVLAKEDLERRRLLQ